MSLGYSFDTPDTSPEFYLLGPLTLTNNDGEVVFNEIRRWQIAADAVTRGGTISTHVTSATTIISPTLTPQAIPILIDSREAMESAKIKQPAKILPLVKHHYRANENITARVINIKDPNVKATLLYAGGEEVSLPISKEVIGEETVLRISPGSSFKPGKYTLKVIDSNGQESTQDFTWGVLAININKSIYLPSETAKIAMAVLDEMGMMVCDAKLKLTIKENSQNINDELTTENGKIIVNPECQIHDFTLKPDYEASYQIKGPGKYEMILTAETKNGNYTITDSFEVKESVRFDVERDTATRIYPPKIYPVTFNIASFEDFEGEIEEVVPKDFQIFPAVNNRSYDEIREQGEEKIITWKVSLKKGESLTLGYKFDAPDISPQFYLLGPLTLFTSEVSLAAEGGNSSTSEVVREEVFSEARQWQIAADASVTKYPTAVVEAAEDPYDNNAWTTETNVMVDDGVNASITAPTFDSPDYSYVLKATGFSAGVPTGSTIDGILVAIERYNDAGETGKDAVVQLTKTGTRIGDNKADTVNNWPTTATIKEYGGAADKWGTTWTVAEVNASTFGVHLAAQATTANADIYVDFIRITVYYTPGAISTVSTTGTQTADMLIPSTNQYVGGAFTFVRNIDSANVTQIIITDAGTVTANTNLSNVDLYYETAVSCSYEGTETLFGTAASFNVSEKATVTGTMAVGTDQVCVYVVLDVGVGATAAQTLEIEISDPSTEVTVSTGTVSPATAVAISGTTELTVWLSGWAYRKRHVINPSSGAGTNYQVKVTANAGSGADSGADVYLNSKARSDFGDVRFTDDNGSTLLDYWLESHDDEQVLDSNPYANEWDATVYGIMSGYLYWSNTRSNGALGHIYKTNLTTEATTTHYTGDYFAAWQGLVVGSTTYAVGQEKDAGGTLRASLHAITSAGVTAARRSDTDDCNELIGVDTDGTYIVAGERGTGGIMIGSSYPNSSGLWRIPISTATDPATWTREYEDPSGYEWVSIAYFNSKWYALLSDYKGSWKVISSSNLTSWSIEKDYTNQTINLDIRGTLINTGSKLVVLAPVQSSNSYHMLVYDGSEWIDFDLSISLSYPIKGLWNSVQSKIIIFVSGGLWESHDVYTVGLDGTSVTQLFTTYQTGRIEHLQSQAASFVTGGDGKQYFPVTHATAITGDIRSINLSSLSYASQVNFWVEVTDDLSTTAQSIYIYYGKPSVTTTSSGDNTFVEFIDGQTDESSKFTLVDLSNSGINASLTYDPYGKLHRIIISTPDNVGATITGVSGSNYEIWADVSMSSGYNSQMGFILRYSASGVYYIRDLSATSATAKHLTIMEQATPPNTTEITLDQSDHTDYHLPGINYRVTARASGTSFSGNTSHENLSVGATDASFSTGSWGLYAGYVDGPKITFKNIVVRKYISPEPSHGTWGSETSTITLTQNYYRWYANADSVQPGSALAAENGKLSTVGADDVLRLRISGQAYGGSYSSGETFKLQYATDTGGTWYDVGAIDSGVIWRGYNNSTPADGDPITSTLLSVSDVIETYEEENNSAASPNSIAEAQDGEWDWVIQENVSTACQIYYFRLVKSTGAVLDNYNRYPVLIGKSCSQNSLSTADSFQRKTFYESGSSLSWKFFYDGDSIESWYSSNSGTAWAEGTNADLAVNTNDFTLWHVPGDTYVYIVYTTSNDIKVRIGTFTATDINWGAEYTALNGSGASDNYQYPFLTRDSLGYIQVTARWDNGTNYYIKTTRSDRSDDVSSWTGKVYNLSDTSNTNSNVYGVNAPLASGHVYSAWIKETALEGKRWFNSNVSGDGQSPSWWNANYDKRKKLTVWATDAVSSGYTAKFTTSDAEAADIYNNSRSDGNDFRILYWTGSVWSELDRDLTKFTSSNIEVWFKLQAGISAGSSDGNYYAYYSYPSATSPPANKANIYKFFDNFDRADDGLGANWTTNNGTWAISSNVAKQTSTAIQDPVKARYTGGAEPADNEQLAKVRLDVALDVGSRFGLTTRVDDAGGTGRGYNLLIYNNSGTYQARFLNDGVAWGGSTDYTTAVGTWYWMRFRVVGSNLYGKIWRNGADEPSNWTIEQPDWTGRIAGDTGLTAGGESPSATNARASFEDWWLRDTVTNEPTVTAGYWESSAASIGTGVTGLNNNMSVVADSSGNVHLLYINSSDYAVYQEYTTSWQTAVPLDETAGSDYATISINTANNDLYAFWIRSNVIYYKKGVSPYGSANWDSSATSWQATGTNTYVTSNYSGSSEIFAEWTEGASSPYTIKWDKIVIEGPSGPTLNQLLRHGGWFNSSGVKQPFTF
ncbi:DUF2341 domain-containing protein [Patescibacteria group bacterium]|nr:DUF2341 domain-containing protein [Patescibacteria group bacterium]